MSIYINKEKVGWAEMRWNDNDSKPSSVPKPAKRYSMYVIRPISTTTNDVMRNDLWNGF